MDRNDTERCAVIDIGTNTVNLLVCDVDRQARSFSTVLDMATVTRLGEGMADAPEMQRSAMNRTCTTVRKYLARGRQLGVNRVVGVGTSVLRDATNATEFLDLVRSGFQLDVSVIPGATEARMSYLSVRTDDALCSPDADRLIITDVGAGSAEVVVGRVMPDAREVDTSFSLNMGAVHATQSFLKDDPPTAGQLSELSAWLKEILAAQAGIPSATPPMSTTLVGVGGTIVNLAAVKLGLSEIDIEQIHGETLTLDDLEDQIRLFCAGPVNDRTQIPGLEPLRADIIIAGAAIQRALIKHVGSDEIHVSTRGLRFGVMYDHFVTQGEGEATGHDEK